MRCKTVNHSVLGMAIVIFTSLSSIPASAGTIILYHADPDNDVMTPAPNPTTVGWGIVNLGNVAPSAGFSNPGLTTGGAPAWILNDAGATGQAGRNAGNQTNNLYYDLDAATVAAMDANGFTLTLEFEQLSTGAFVAIGLEDNDFDLTGGTRFGQVPASGLQTYVYSWDGATLSTPAGSASSSGNNSYWVGLIDGGMRISFADNTQNTSLFRLAITQVTLTTVPEPATVLMMGLGMLGVCAWRKCRA